MRLPSFRSSRRGESPTERPAHRLLRYVREGKHSCALHLLLTETGAEGSGDGTHDDSTPLQSLLDKCASIVGEPLLHHLLKHQPSADLVDFILSKECANLPFASASPCRGTDHRDEVALLLLDSSQGWTPLHVAVAFGCSLSVVECLLHDHNGGRMAAIQDACGRYPLHWACLSPVEHGKHHHRIVSHLLHAYPEAAHARDKDGNSPLNLARAHRASSRVVRLLVSKACTLSVSATLPVPCQNPGTRSVPRAVSSDSSSLASRGPLSPSSEDNNNETVGELDDQDDGVSSLGWEG